MGNLNLDPISLPSQHVYGLTALQLELLQSTFSLSRIIALCVLQNVEKKSMCLMAHSVIVIYMPVPSVNRLRHLY